MIQKNIIKIHSTSCVNIYHDMKTFEVDGMVQDIKIEYAKKKTLLFHEMKILKLCHKDYIFRNYNFFAEVTFKYKQ